MTSVRVTVPRKRIRVQRPVKPPVFLVVLPASVTGWDWVITSYHDANGRVVNRSEWGPLNQTLGSEPDTSHGDAFAPLDAYAPPLTIPEPIGLQQPQARIFQRSAGGHPDPPARLEFGFEVTGVKLSGANLGKPARVGEGYLHFSLNDGRFDQPRYSGQNAILAAKLGLQGKYSVAFKPTITYRNLPPGRYRLTVYLANNDHTHTGIGEQVPFIIRPGQRSARRRAPGS